MRIACVLMLLLALVATGGAEAQPADPDWAVCVQSEPYRRIHGCSAVLARGNRETAGNRAIAHANRGAALRARGNLDTAISDYNEAIRLDPRFADAFIGRGNAHRDRGNRDAAMSDYSEAIRLDPRNAFAFSNRGNAHFDRGNLDAAMSDYNEAIRLDPRNAFAFSNRALVHERRNAREAQRSDLLQAIALGRTQDQARLDALERSMASARPPAVQPPLPPQPSDAVEVALWQSADAGRRITDYEEYLRQFPQGRFAALARTRLAEARAAPVRPAASGETRVALVIGNGSYRHAGLLPNARRDAEAMAGLLRELGFTRVTLHLDLDLPGMIAALRAFEGEADTADWALVYFAGHGIEVNGVNHLVPVDARLRSDRDVADETVTLARVLERTENARRLRLIILDACRDNPFLERMQRVATRSINRGLARVPDVPPGTMVAFAARAGQVAQDGTGTNSPFVEALLRRLPEPGVELGLVFRHVRDDVLARTGRRQEPWVDASLPGEAMFFRAAR